MWYRSQA